MLVTPSSRIVPSSFQQLLPVELPAPVTIASGPPPAPVLGRSRTDPREFPFGLLTAFCSPELVDQVVAECGRQERRCRLLPARLMVYALLLMCLHSQIGYDRLIRHLAGLAEGWGSWVAPHKSAFMRARQRLGWEVMERLFRVLARPLADPARDHACFWRGRRVVALDGTTAELAVSPELEQAFGGQIANDGTGRRVGPPRARLVSLIECGTRALLDVVLGHYEEGENTLARSLVRSLSLGMLLLADRGFPSKRLRNRAAWDRRAAQYETGGRRAWAAADPFWGIWRVPESELGVLPDVNGLDVVELGCGTGYVSAWLARRGARPVGIDNSASQLAPARRFQREFGLDFPLIHANAEEVPLADERFDLVVSEYGACIWCDPYRWVPEAARLLRPGGRLVFLVKRSAADAVHARARRRRAGRRGAAAGLLRHAPLRVAGRPDR